LELPPHPESAINPAAKIISIPNARHDLRRTGRIHNINPQTDTPAIPRQPTDKPGNLCPSRATELVAAVELMVTAVFKPSPGVTIAVPFGIEHVGGTSGLTVPL
jgi:hypothetical protein